MDRTKAGLNEGFLSIIVNAVLFVTKMWASMVSGSIALAADAWHTLSDSITSVIVVIGVLLSTKKADKEHPFGHGRWEQIVSIFVALILGIIAYDFLVKSIVRFQYQERALFGTVALVVTIISILVKEALAQYAFYLGRKTGNTAITADGWHHRSDSLSSVVVLAGIIVARFFESFWWIDSVLGIFTALVLFYATFAILKESITVLLGEVASPELVAQITADIKNIHPDDLQAHHFHIHNYIIHKELTLHIRLENQLSIEQGHLIAKKIEYMIKENYNIVATVRVEPLFSVL
jgi:cation diffusion facilitator family transporter